ncbi:fatty acid desaturase family protein [Pendulispora rubella]|uniref:Fatty acid desaturase family protein n=1 Tax=Pendulispora rubella TaxID=2741070 RepID=A0ABZ2LB71_9BACT
MFKVKDVLSHDEIRALTARSDAAGFWAVGSTWAIIALAFAVLARWPHPMTFVLAVVVLGGRQLALSILMHEAAHRSLFARRAGNDVLTDWLCARPVWNDVARYRKHHAMHHAHTGTDLDPDRSLADPFPVSRRSLVRKFARDLVGITAVKRVIGLVLMDLEVLEYTVAANVTRRPRNGRRFFDYAKAGLRNGGGMLLTNGALAGVLAATGHLWLYSAWVVAYFTTFSLFVRIRSLAEHACTERGADPFRNTRTTQAGFLARLTVAPCHVNYHIEHHLLVAVPYYRLPKLHRLLRARGAIGEVVPNYAAVLAIVTA